MTLEKNQQNKQKSILIFFTNEFRSIDILFARSGGLSVSRSANIRRSLLVGRCQGRRDLLLAGKDHRQRARGSLRQGDTEIDVTMAMSRGLKYLEKLLISRLSGSSEIETEEPSGL